MPLRKIDERPDEKTKKFRQKDQNKKRRPPKGLDKDTTTSAYGDAGRGRPDPFYDEDRPKGMNEGGRPVPGFLKDSKPKRPPIRTRPGQNPKGKNVPILERAPKGLPTRRKKMMGGGSLKPVDPKTQKGLSKLPTEVRNKMGYMKKGGRA